MTMQAPQRGILIVEDDHAIRDALTQILEEEGYHVVGAANGKEAISRLHSMLRPCVILLDLMMPVMNGWQFRAAQQADPEIASIPTVVISADANVEEKAAEINAIDYLKKPVRIDRLLHMVARYCS